MNGSLYVRLYCMSIKWMQDLVFYYNTSELNSGAFIFC